MTKNQHGGPRAGSGRPPKPKDKLAIAGELDSLEFLRRVQNDPEAEASLRVRAAVTLAQYQHIRRGDGGKKDEQRSRAEKAGRGRFRAPAAPRLVVVNAK